VAPVLESAPVTHWLVPAGCAAFVVVTGSWLAARSAAARPAVNLLEEEVSVSDNKHT